MKFVEIKELDLKNKKALNDFVDLPWKIYKDHKYWVAPLKMAIKETLNPKHPFYETADVKMFLAYKDNEAVGRIMAINNKSYNKHCKTNIGHFGFFDVIDDVEVSKKLIEAATNYLASQGLTSIEGPMNPGTNYECGLLVKGHDDYPQIMMTYTPQYYLTHLESLGFDKSMDLLAYHYHTPDRFPEIILNIANRIEQKSNISYRRLNIKNWDKELDIIFDIYNSAWEENWGFVPMTRKEFEHSAKDLKMVLNPDFVHYVLVDGVEAGFILALPDFNQIFKTIPKGTLSPSALFKLLTPKKRISRLRVIMMGVKKQYRKMGIETLLYRNLQTEVLAKNARISDVEFSWILETNTEMNKPLIRLSGEAYKRYRLVKKAI